MPRLRFSLMSFLLFCVWAAALVGVYLRREPWVLDHKLTAYAGIVRRLSEISSKWRDTAIAPDQKRQAEPGKNAIGFVIRDTQNDETISATSEDVYVTKLNFPDDETLEMIAFGDSPHLRIYRRRYPEWWWGHLYRVEVWLAVLLPFVGIWRAVRARRKDSTSYPASGASSSPG